MFYKLIKEKNEALAEFYKSLDSMIELADDILDHKKETEFILLLLVKIDNILQSVASNPDFYKTIKNHLNILLSGELFDSNFVPRRCPVEDEISTWKLKWNRMSVAFACLCYSDKQYDTEENWKWIKDTQIKRGIQNDCDDILSATFEDFIQCRRNYVALMRFNMDIYFNWRTRKKELIEKAIEINNGVEIKKPVNDIMLPIYDYCLGG